MIVLFLLISGGIPGQCINEPTITLNSRNATTCGMTPITVTGSFGGSATMVIITENGKGSVSPGTSRSSPFTFTYMPKHEDIGKEISITITTNNPSGKPCKAAVATCKLFVNDIPSPPGIGMVTQPSCSQPTGSVVLKDLPNEGTWTITSTSDGSTFTGTGTSTTVSGLQTGNYNFNVTNSSGCISPVSGNINIAQPPPAPKLVINDPSPVCYPSTVNLTAPITTKGSTSGLTYTYWKNNSATQKYPSPEAATEGTYYIKGTTAAGCYDIEPVRVTIKQRPEANAGSDQVLEYQFMTKLDASGPVAGETGRWFVISGSGKFSDFTDPGTTVQDLSLGRNIFIWTLTNGVCPPSFDSVMVTVHDLVIPTLITPNMDGRNDYFIIREDESQGKPELIIFNRKGVQVYRSMNYDNKWNGVNSDGNPLEEGTYFYLLKTGNGRSSSGFIVIRR